ncbi:DUF7426 family protein [Actinoplanes sp. CA-054009]
MATTFSELDDFLSPGLVLTVRGKEYTVPLASGELGLWCRRTAELAGQVHAASTADEVDAAVQAAKALPAAPGEKGLTMHERTLGTAYQLLLDDEVPDPYIQFCGETAYVWIVAGEEQAARYWTSGGRSGEGRGPGNRAARRSAQKTGGAAANATPSPGSTSGTKPRRRNGRRPAPR